MTLMAAAPVTVGIGPEVFEVRDPDAATAALVYQACRLDDRRRRHWSAPHVVALLSALVDVGGGPLRLESLLARRRDPVPLRTLTEAAQWSVEQVAGRPYGEVYGLAGYAAASWRTFRGRILLAGGRPADAYSLADALDMAEAALEERIGPVKLREVLAEQWESRDEWGTSGTAEAAQAAMFAL